MDLRPYQSDCVEAVYESLRLRDDNPCAVVPTGGGKTPILATICRDSVKEWQGRVLVLAHVKELLEQTCDKLAAICPDVRYGVYSAGLGKRDTEHDVIVAGIQSVYKRACDLGAFNLILVDEAHLIPKSGDGMYRQFLADAKVVNPEVRVVGFTATPYRTSDGLICDAGGILNHVCYEISVRELIEQGYLCPLVSKAGKSKTDFSNLHVRAGEFVAYEIDQLMDDAALVASACEEIVEHSASREGVLLFCSGVKHAEHVVERMATAHGVDCGLVTGDTTLLERESLLTRFKRRELKYLANVKVLTTGFDAPHVDCVALLRPTLSPGLYYQMVGRGFRLSPGKADCLVLDFGGNVLRHGPVDDIITKEKSEREGGGGGGPRGRVCDECGNICFERLVKDCPDCGAPLPVVPIAKHDPRSSDAAILSSGRPTVEEHEVKRIWYGVHVKKGAEPDAPRTLRVDYQIGGIGDTISEWICLEHEGFAGEKARAWWMKRSPDPVPTSIERAVEIAEGGGLAEPTKIKVKTKPGERWPRITGYELGPKPEPIDLTQVPTNEIDWSDLGELPF